MKDKLILVMDCGATNVRSVAINSKGQIKAIHSVSNNTRPDPEYPQYVIWDAKEIWNKLVQCTREVFKQIDPGQIAGVTITTFGVDGAPFDATGNMLYPVISWQCQRTTPIMENIDKYIPLNELYQISGVQPAGINTINKLIWLKENKPRVLEKMDAYLFIPSIFVYYLTGEMVTDFTMASTSMLTDLNEQDLSGKILSSIGLVKEQFPKTVKPGEIAGKVIPGASGETGIPEGVPVIVAGHDTQFAIFGSGADENVPVLSSGTWEILMARVNEANINQDTFNAGLTTEFDAIPGLYNMGVNSIGSGVIEWMKKMYFADEKGKDSIWETMICEAEKEPAGSNGIFIHPTFFPGSMDNTKGTIFGLSMNTTRGSIFRATLEALACLTRKNLELIQTSGGFKAKKIICVGGGSKNRLWNQIRANVTGVPIELISQKETTVLGAALFAMAAIGIYDSPEEAKQNINFEPQHVQPQEDVDYEAVYQRFLKLPGQLKNIYR